MALAPTFWSSSSHSKFDSRNVFKVTASSGVPRGFSSKVYVGAERLSLQSLNIRWWRKQIGFVGQDWGLDILLTSLIGSMYGIFTYLYHKNPNPIRYKILILWFWGESWLRTPIYVGDQYTSCTHCHSPFREDFRKTASCRCWKDGNPRNHDGVSLRNESLHPCFFISTGEDPKIGFKRRHLKLFCIKISSSLLSKTF